MIKNERQYRITRTQANSFERALKGLSDVAAAERNQDSLRFTIQEDALRAQLDDLRTQLREYELLRANPGVIEIPSLDQLPRALIQARIAAGLSQQQLAARLGLKAQQVQRYEATEYAGVSIDRVRDILNALGVEVRNELLLPTSPRSVGAILKKLQAVGIDRGFLERRLLPADLREHLAAFPKASGDDTVASRLIQVIGRIFNWTPEQFLSAEPLTFDNAILSTVRYKRAAREPSIPLSAYTIYAHYLALLVLHCVGRPASTTRERTPQDIHQALVSSYGGVSLLGVLDFLWHRDIPVLPLRDPGVFHAAWWRIDGQDVIAVKQRTSSTARWIVDLLHEYFHAIDGEDESDDAVVEDTDVLIKPGTSEVERKATDFAINIAFGGREEELAQACVKVARGKVEWLKAAVPQVAERSSVDVGMLANFLAYRLSFQNINWWPTAHGLQPQQEDPLKQATEFLKRIVTLDRLTPLDRELLWRALDEG